MKSGGNGREGDLRMERMGKRVKTLSSWSETRLEGGWGEHGGSGGWK